ncbi:hypothetical protein ACFRCQ_27370 [Cytobacillus firmus]|uniref:hypothetical protein n=1 Tax=Cytobacillus firmus TaxID=1399 RepID=UPI0036A5126A
MFRKTIFALFLFCFFSIGTVGTFVDAESFELFDVPNEMQSDKWKVELGEVKYVDNMAKPKKGVNEMYSLKITNIGNKDLKNVKIDFYRNEPNSMTRYGLHTPSERQDVFKKGRDFSFSNLPISLKATELEVVISWQDDPSSHIDGKVIKLKGGNINRRLRLLAKIRDGLEAKKVLGDKVISKYLFVIYLPKH